MKILGALLFILSFSLFAKPLPKVDALLTEANSAQWSRAISTSIIINAPVAEVWKYASDSTKAHDWSVFFDHISPLPGIPDGQIGALRRCHRMADESGGYWDEVVIDIKPQQMRQITTYNISKFKFNRLAKGQYAFVRQLYEAIDEHTTKMTFQTIAAPTANIFGRIGFKISSRDTKKIFLENLENIKANIEGYPRPHAWY